MQSILLIEDNAGDARLLCEMLKERSGEAIAVVRVETMAQGEATLLERIVDMIVLDLGLPDVQGLEAVRRARAAAPRTPIVVLTGHDDEALALQTLQQGAQDYLTKGRIDTHGLLRALRYAVERKASEEVLFSEKERAEVTLRCIGDGVASTDLAGKILFLNVVAEELTGWTWQSAIGRPASEVFQIVDARNRLEIPDTMSLAMTADRQVHPDAHAVLVRRDGSETAIEDSVAPIHDRTGRVAGAVRVIRDVTSARAMGVQVTHAAEHDFLTGLPNRLLFADRVGQAIAMARRHGRQVAVLFLDLDGFKHINDSSGHLAGDKLLQSVAQRLISCVRTSDTVCRQGGDEFVVLLSEMAQAEDAAIPARRMLQAAAATAKRMLQAVAETHEIDEKVLRVTTCIGVSVYPEDGEDAETLIRNADTAMYQAKANGRQSYRFFESAMNVRAAERQFIEEGLRAAIQEDQLFLQYQPRFDLETGEISALEALVRWTHPTRGPITPAEFIPVAEDSGLILPLGRWVLHEACRQAREWLDSGVDLRCMAVNVSAVEFGGQRFLEGVDEVLRETGLPSTLLELELTETVLMKRVDATERTLRSLRERGIRLAVDDFGTGYSSLSYLSRFPITALKIDQSFIRRITSAPAETGIVTAVIAMGRSMNLRVVAEGVETEDELRFLKEQRCNEAQGYLLSRPLRAGVLTERWRSGRWDHHEVSPQGRS